MLLTNYLFGWGGILFFTYLARKTGKKIYYVLGSAIYIVSWGMLLAGVYLAGAAILKATHDYIPAWVIVVVMSSTLAVFIFIMTKAKKEIEV